MEDYISPIRSQECRRCEEDLPLSKFQKSFSIMASICSDCLRIQSNESNKKIRARIKEASNGCWWVEAFCSNVIKRR